MHYCSVSILHINAWAHHSAATPDCPVQLPADKGGGGGCERGLQSHELHCAAVRRLSVGVRAWLAG